MHYEITPLAFQTWFQLFLGSCFRVELYGEVFLGDHVSGDPVLGLVRRAHHPQVTRWGKSCPLREEVTVQREA